MDEDRTPRTALRRSSALPVVLAVALIAGAAGWWWWSQRPAPGAHGPPPPTAEPAAPAAPASAPAAAPDRPADPARVRSLLEAAMPDATFRRWLGESDLVRRWAAAIDEVARGASPRGQVELLAPERPFSAARRGGPEVIAERSYARFDRIADAVATVDAAAVAVAYRALHPALEAAYRAVAPPGASLDQATARALRRIRSAPIEDGPVAVEPRGGIYVFSDARLEALPDLEKHLVRMGPRNARIVQAKARDLEQALGLPADAAADRR